MVCRKKKKKGEGISADTSFTFQSGGGIYWATEDTHDSGGDTDD